MIGMMNSLYGNYRTRTFTEIFPNEDTFVNEVRESRLNNPAITTEHLQQLYYLLYAAYGNSNIASSDENQFKYKMYTIIFNKGGKWQKNLEIQERLENLTESEITQINKVITNHAFNPGEIDAMSNGIDGETLLNYINDQTANTMKGSILTAYNNYITLLLDVSTDFIREFKPLFLTIVQPELPLWYISSEEDEN